MIDFYSWSTPNGQRVAIALEESGLAYKAHPLALPKREQKNPDFLLINPCGKIPAIVDHEANVKLFESGAILNYIAEKSGKLMPKSVADRWQAQQWLFWSSAGLSPAVGMLVQLSRNLPDQTKALDKVKSELQEMWHVLDGQLAGKDYILGEYGIADIAAYPFYSRMATFSVDVSASKNVKAWADRIAARPAVQRGLDVVPVPKAA
jgi:GST-like protein